MGIDLNLIRFLRAVKAINNSIPLVLSRLNWLNWHKFSLLVAHRLVIGFGGRELFFVQLVHIDVLEAHRAHKLSLFFQTDFLRLRAVKRLIAINSRVVDRDNARSTSLRVGNSSAISVGGCIYLGIERVIPLSSIILFSGLVPLSVVNLTNSFLLQVCPVDCLGVIVRNTRCFRSTGY